MAHPMVIDLERINRVLDDLAAERDPRDRLLLSPDEADLAELAALLKAARDEPATPDAGFVEALWACLANGAAGLWWLAPHRPECRGACAGVGECVTAIWKINDGTNAIPGGEAMDKVMIVLDGSAVDVRLVELAGALLAGKNVEVTLLHVVPDLPHDDRGWDDAVVLEGYVAAEQCDVVVAPLIERLHAGFAPPRQSSWSEPRLVPRHLIHHDDARGVFERCGIAQQRRDSLDLLAASAERLRQCGIDMTRVTRDSALGNPAEIVRATITYLGVDLVIVGDYIASHGRHGADDSGWDRVMAEMPCPVLVVPVADDASPGGESRAPRPSRVAPA